MSKIKLNLKLKQKMIQYQVIFLKGLNSFYILKFCYMKQTKIIERYNLKVALLYTCI